MRAYSSFVPEQALPVREQALFVREQATFVPEQTLSLPEQALFVPEQTASVPEQASSVPAQVSSFPAQAALLSANSGQFGGVFPWHRNCLCSHRSPMTRVRPRALNKLRQDMALRFDSPFSW
jgi:hypothetical protein